MEQNVIDVKEKEYDNLIQNGVFEEVPYNGQKLVLTRWVFRGKEKNQRSTSC